MFESSYIGNRYLRPLIVSTTDVFEKGSNSVIGAITYRLNPRYTVTFSQEYNFDYGHNVKSSLAIVRRYHRMLYGLIVAVDESRDNNIVSLAIWPQGIKEMALGSRDLVGLTGAYSEE